MWFRIILALAMMPAFALASPLTITGADGQTITINQPNRIVTVNATTAEIIAELGQSQRIVGTDNSAIYPETIAKLPKLGHPRRVPAEGAISLRPDLIIGTQDDLTAQTAQQLRGAKVPVLMLKRTDIDGIPGLKERINMLATALDAKEASKKLIERLDSELATLAQRIKEHQEKTHAKSPKVLFLYSHGGGTTYAYGTQTGVQTLLDLAGATNAVDFSETRTAYNAEAIVTAAPDAIVMLHRSFDTVGGLEGVLKIPGVSLTPAGKNKRIIQVDNSVRWVGPRFPQFATELAQALGTIAPTSTPTPTTSSDNTHQP